MEQVILDKEPMAVGKVTYYFNGERKSCYDATEEDCQGTLKIILEKIYRGGV